MEDVKTNLRNDHIKRHRAIATPELNNYSVWKKKIKILVTNYKQISQKSSVNVQSLNRIKEKGLWNKKFWR